MKDDDLFNMDDIHFDMDGNPWHIPKDEDPGRGGSYSGSRTSSSSNNDNDLSSCIATVIILAIFLGIGTWDIGVAIFVLIVGGICVFYTHN